MSTSKLVAAMVTVLAMFIAAAAPAHAVQHLVNPGDKWDDIAQRARPGDEIILMPGEHRPAALENLHGTAGRPIIIRSLTSSNPATIEAARYGLRLRRPQYVEVRDIVVVDASVNGIEITDEGPGRDGKPWAANVVIENVHIARTGPIGRRNSIALLGLEHVTVRNCRFEGWGGSGVELVACTSVTIEQCRFIGLEEFSQMNAVQVRAGSQKVTITKCIMDNPGVMGIALGGTSAKDAFRDHHSSEPRHEASKVTVTRNLIRGGHSAFAFINCSECVVRNNTAYRPQRWVYLVLDETTPDRLPSMDVSLSLNLFAWEASDVQTLTFVKDGADASGLRLEQNLWWSPNLAENRQRLGTPAGKVQARQHEDVDPKLNDNLVPTERRTIIFGYDAP